jgi:SHS2 domain-containing protein
MPSGLPRYDYFDHDADTGVIGRGGTLPEAFVHAAEATFALMCDPVTVEPREKIEFEFDEDDVELALVAWLNGLLAHANERGLALGRLSWRRVLTGVERLGGTWRPTWSAAPRSRAQR